MIISDDFTNKFTIRNRQTLSVMKRVEHDYGCLYCGLCYPEQKVVVLGIGKNLVEFNYELMEFTK